MLTPKHLIKKEKNDYRLIAISDIHGHLDRFKELLRKVNYDPVEDYLVIIGDFVEKGDQVLETIHFIMNLSRFPKCYVLMGNCEWAMNALLTIPEIAGEIPKYLKRNSKNGIIRDIYNQEQTGGGLGLRGGHARNNPQGPLFYNIYNIGANSSDQDGIDFASSRNWDTREKAILYGSKYLSDNYITKGQDSLYLQKFDVHNNNPGHHYYMSNIRAPYSEAKNMLRGYKSNHMDHVRRILEIPLYTHMPVYNAYPISTDINYSGTIMKNPHCEYQIVNTYKNLIENVDYISINHKTYTHIVGLNNYYGSCDIPK